MLLPLLLLLLLGVNVSGLESVGPNEVATLLAPIYRNVTADDVWVYPNSSFDLGARSMTCECFDPSETCCMPKSTTIAPFCTIQNTTCCGNTYCLAGETCCGDFCCGSGTTCNVKLTGSGCCPKGKMCTSFATCYDHASLHCSNTASPQAGCCPIDTPYCRDFKPNGLGCYASSIIATPSSSVGLAATSMDADLSTMAPQRSGTATVTISAVWNSISISLQFVTNTEPSNAATTVYVLQYPSVLGSAAASPVTVVPTMTGDASSSSTSSAQAISALCHNDNSKTPVPCQGAPSSKITAGSSSGNALTTSNIGYSPPGTSVYKSQASSSSNPFSMLISAIKLCIFSVLRAHALFVTGIAMSLESGDLRSLEFGDYLFVLAVLIPQSWSFFILFRLMFRLLRAIMSLNAADPRKPAATLPKSDIGEIPLLPIQQRIAKLNQSTQISLNSLVNHLDTLPPGAVMQKVRFTLQATVTDITDAIIDIHNLLASYRDQQPPSIQLVPSSGRRLTSQSRLGREISAPVPSTLRPLKHRSIKAAKEDIHMLEGSGRRFSQAVRENQAEVADPEIHEKGDGEAMPLPEDECGEEAEVEDEEEEEEAKAYASRTNHYHAYGVTQADLEETYESATKELDELREWSGLDDGLARRLN